MKDMVTYENFKGCSSMTGSDCKKNWKTIVRLKDHETDLGEFEVIYCNGCKIGFTNPYPTEETVGFLYQKKENSDFDSVTDSPIDRMKDYLSRRVIRRVAPKTKVDAILDYSTGNGRFAVTAKKLFPDAIVDAVDYQP